MSGSKSRNYYLINPYIEGSSFENVFNAKKPGRAAKDAYTSMSKHFSAPISECYLTMMDAETKKLFHYKVEEKVKKVISGGGQKNKVTMRVKCDITVHNIDEERNAKIIKDYESKTSIRGGSKKKDDDSSDSDSSSSSSSSSYKSKDNKDPFLSQVYPISYYWYTPWYYYKTKNINVYTPSFVFPITPIVSYTVDFDVYVP